MKSNILYHLDWFGKTPQTYINQHERYGTLYSLIISIITSLLCVGFTLYYFTEMFLRNGMTLIQAVELTTNPLRTNIQRNHFFLSASLQDPITYDAVIDEQIYTVEASFRSAQRKENGDFEWFEKPIDLALCSEIDIKQEYRSIFIGKPLNHIYCVNDTEIDLDGTFLNDYYSMIMFRFFQCVNLTDEKKQRCKSQADMDYYLNGTFISLMFSDVSINANDYHKPDKPILSEAYSTISSDSIKEMHVFLKGAIVTTQENLYFRSLINDKYYSQFDYLKDMQRSKLSQNVNKDQIAEITFKLNNKIEHYKRNYLTITTVIGNIGGIIKAITFVATLLTTFVGNAQYESFIINKIFSQGVISPSLQKSIKKNDNTEEVVSFSNHINNHNPNQQTGISTNNFLTQKKHLFASNNLQGRETIYEVIEKAATQIRDGGETPQKARTQIQMRSQISKKSYLETSNSPSSKTFKGILKRKATLSEKVVSEFMPYFYRKNNKVIEYAKSRYILRAILDVLNVNKTIIDSQRLKTIMLTNEQNTVFNLKYMKDVNDYELEKQRFESLYKDDYNDCYCITARDAYNYVKKDYMNTVSKSLIGGLDKNALQTIIAFKNSDNSFSCS